MGEQNKPRPLDRLSAYSESLYSSIDLNRLASFTIHWLKERRIPMTFENIVVASFRMFPVKFALEGYSEYPDAARINRPYSSCVRNIATGHEEVSRKDLY
jgi:hypothetical protein